MDIQLKSLMNDYVADYMQKEPFDFVVKNALPVIWFGNLEKYKASKQKIVTVGINPSNQEFPSGTKPRFDVPSLFFPRTRRKYTTLLIITLLQTLTGAGLRNTKKFWKEVLIVVMAVSCKHTTLLLITLQYI